MPQPMKRLGEVDRISIGSQSVSCGCFFGVLMASFEPVHADIIVDIPALRDASLCDAVLDLLQYEIREQRQDLGRRIVAELLGHREKTRIGQAEILAQ
jgi:hypothetical protein